ncbi:centromere protein I-like isoform X2 [Ornithodoros turicata]|uniref:centromere protein I-like isoform X2 n=1 Tax=Ornithodoros turicata TaxID=34597 RepID=UPI0031391700
MILSDHIFCNLAMEEAIKFFAEGKGKATSQVGRTSCKTLQSESVHHGLLGQHLTELSTVIARNAYGVPTSKRLLKCMIPRYDVPGEAVMRLLPALAKRDIPNGLKVEIVKWITAAFQLLADDANLVVIFRVVLLQLDIVDIQEHASNLLVLLASKSTVTNFAVHLLNRIKKKYPSSHHINNLGSIFESCQAGSDLMVDKKQKILKLQYVRHLKQSQARFKGDIERPVTLYDNGNASRAERVEHAVGQYVETWPLDISSLLNNLGIDRATTNLRVQMSDWVFHSLRDAFFYPEGQQGHSTMETLVTIASILGENVPGVEKFLFKYLPYWDGDLHSSAVFALVSRLSLSSTAKAFLFVLGPIHVIFMLGSLEKQREVLECLTRLCKHWIAQAVAESEGRSARIFDSDACDDDEVDSATAITSLLEYIDSCVTVIPTFHGIPPPDILLVILNFYNMLLDAYEETTYFVCDIPQWSVVVACFYSSSLLCLDQFCKLLLRCRQAVQEIKQYANFDFVQDFNRCFAWVTSSFGKHDWEETNNVPNFTHPVSPESLAGVGPRHEAFSLWRHPAFHLPLANFCAEQGITPDALKRDPDLLLQYVEYLSGYCPSVVQLIRQSALHVCR